LRSGAETLGHRESIHAGFETGFKSDMPPVVILYTLNQ